MGSLPATQHPARERGPGEKILSLVIVSYRCRDLLRACLKSVERELSPRYQVIVSDNGSEDGSIEMVQRDFPFVELLCNRANLGFARANNIALEKATGRYVLLLNPDTELTGETLQSLISYMEREPAVSAAGCRVLYPDRSYQPSSGYLPSISTAIVGGVAANRLFRRLFPDRDLIGASGLAPLPHRSATREVETLLGACVIIRRSALERTGYFDENMFMYFEECDLFLRLAKSGGRIMYMTGTEIIHHAGGTTKSIGKSVAYYHRSLEYYLTKNFSLHRVRTFRFAMLLSALLKSVLLSLLFISRPSQRLKSKISWHWHSFRFFLGLASAGKRWLPAHPVR